MNLLIFFIITAVFVKEIGITVSRPNAANAEKKEAGSIVVAIRPDGEIVIDSRVVDIRAVRANIERLHAQRPEDAVVVAADKGAHTGVLVNVIDQVRQGAYRTCPLPPRRVEIACCPDATLQPSPMKPVSTWHRCWTSS